MDRRGDLPLLLRQGTIRSEAPRMIAGFYQLPVYMIGAGIFVVLVLSSAAGYALAQRRPREAGEEEVSDLTRGAVTGLLAIIGLLLAFTFSFGISRYEDRRAARVDEANAVMTAFLRAEILPEAEARRLRTALRDYAETRVFEPFLEAGGTMDEALARSLAAQDVLWPTALAGAARLEPPERAFLLSAVNDVLDDHLLRVAAATERIPLVVLGLAVVLAAAVGFLSVYDARPRRFPTGSVALQSFALAALVTITIDFDQAYGGLMRLDSWAMRGTVADMDRLLGAGS